MSGTNFHCRICYISDIIHMTMDKFQKRKLLYKSPTGGPRGNWKENYRRVRH